MQMLELSGKTHKFFLGCSLVVAMLGVSVLIPAPAKAAFINSYNNMNNTLPDDGYDLLKSGVPVASSSQCGAPPYFEGHSDGKWGCTTSPASYFANSANNSHQYITMSACSINDDNSPCASGQYQGRKVELAIYTFGAPTTTRNLTIQVVDRGIGDALACHNSITSYYYKGFTSSLPIGTAVSKETDGCESGYSLRPVPASAFEQIVINGVSTNIYKARIVLSYDLPHTSPPYSGPRNGGGSQISFHISADAGSAKLGYSGTLDQNGNTTPNLPQSDPDEHAWVNIYPTNYARTSTMRFYFRPQCTAPAGTSFRIAWKDGNWGDLNSVGDQIQRDNSAVTLYKFRDGDISTRQIVTSFSIGSGYRFQDLNTENYGVKQPYSYMVQFDDVWGGNGISFRHPFESGDARIPCPGGTTPLPPNVVCDRFTHHLQKDDPSGAGTVEYRVSVFPRIANYVTANPANEYPPQLYSSRPSPVWKTFSQAPVYQHTFTVGSGYADAVSNYNPGAGNPNFTLTFPAPQGPDWRVYVEKWDHSEDKNPPSGTSDWVYRSFTSDAPNCYSAACTSMTIQNSPGLPANSVLGGTWFHVTARLQNTGDDDLPQYAAFGAPLTATIPPGNWGQAAEPASEGILKGTFTDVEFDLFSPNGIASRTFSAYPDYFGLFALGPGCSATVNTYEPFALNPYSNPPPGVDAEERENIPFNFGINEGSLPAVVRATTARSFTVTRAGVPIGDGGHAAYSSPSANPETFDYPPGFGTRPLGGSYTDTGSPRWLQAGDVYCINISIDNSTGYVGPGGPTDLASVTPATAQSCSTVVDRPYARFYGGDVSAGGQFGSPGAGSGGINAYTRKGSEYGSGVEFAAFAMQTVNGFASANLRTVAPVPLSGLTFASPPPGLGGNFAGSRQATDFYNDTRMPETTQITDTAVLLNANGIGGANDGEQKWVKTPGAVPLLLRNPPQNYSKHFTLYVEGDVIIQDNIIYGNAGGFASLAAIPNFSLIVLGNIYIANTVTELDGLFVAQPNGAAGGKIYTCATSAGALFAATDVYNNCHTKLKINGALVAQETHFLRTKGTLSERPSLPGPSYTKETFFAPGPAFNNEDLAAESINLAPELYLSRPIFRPTGSQSNGKYDYFVSLPPVL